MKIGMVSCSKLKRNEACKASQMYDRSHLFRFASEYCRSHYDQWYILSAKYGLLSPNEIIQPYDKCLYSMSVEDQERWGRMVADQIRQEVMPEDELYFHTGSLYSARIAKFLKNEYHLYEPMQGLPIGKQMHWYKENH